MSVFHKSFINLKSLLHGTHGDPRLRAGVIHQPLRGSQLQSSSDTCTDMVSGKLQGRGRCCYCCSVDHPSIANQTKWVNFVLKIYISRKSTIK